MSKIEVVHIVATDLDGCIGNNGGIPWHIPADLKRFKELTSGGVVVMGRKTFESLNCKPLPNRVNMVITNNMPFMAKHSRSNAIFFSSVSVAIKEAKYAAMLRGLKEVWIIGGQSIYEQTIPYVDRIELTSISDIYNGDTYYPYVPSITAVNNSGSIVDPSTNIRYEYVTYKVIKKMSDIQEEPTGRKHDSNKPRYSLLPTGTVNQVIQVLEYGAVKYEIGNWQHVPSARTRYYDAAMRHIDDWWNGSEVDEESSLPHLAHAVCCLLFLLWFDEQE